MEAERKLTEQEQLIKIYQQLENAGLMVTAGKKSAAELMVSHDVIAVVRCKDCKYGDMCSIREAMACTTPNAYCWRGERKGG